MRVVLAVLGLAPIAWSLPMAAGEVQQQLLRVAVPVARPGTVPATAARVFGDVRTAARHWEVASDDLPTVVFIDSGSMSEADLVCAYAEWLAVPELLGSRVQVFVSSGSTPGHPLYVAAPGQNFLVAANVENARAEAETACRKALADPKLSTWTPLRDAGSVQDGRTAFWKWLRTQPPTRVFWLARRFGWMETPTYLEHSSYIDALGNMQSSIYMASTGEQSEWHWLKRFPGLSQHIVIPVLPMGSGFRFVPDSSQQPDPENPGEGPRSTLPPPLVFGADARSALPSILPPIPPPQLPEPVGSFRREWKHALQFAGWFGGSVYGPRKQIGQALSEAIGNERRFRVLEFPVSCPAKGGPHYGPVAIAGTAAHSDEWRRGAACGGSKEPWNEVRPAPVRLLLSHPEIEPCVKCLPPSSQSWRLGLRLPEQMLDSDTWDVFVLDKPRDDHTGWLIRRSRWERTAVAMGAYLPLHLPKSKIARHIVILLRRPGTTEVFALVKDVEPIPRRR